MFLLLTHLAHPFTPQTHLVRTTLIYFKQLTASHKLYVQEKIMVIVQTVY